MEEWPEAAAESGGCNDSLRATHDRLGPRAVSAGRAMLGDWLAGLKAPA
ncbi:hypothetical protein M2346_001803 [Sphingobium xanthum]|nr:hypothetical protein [Sphingobium sp. B10D3B]MCW2401783.1 hypothetical protein [Sphingobium sp. B10D7B]MCW2408762.1 hypothetical protein [Sphingobium xanthum]